MSKTKLKPFIQLSYVLMKEVKTQIELQIVQIQMPRICRNPLNPQFES